MTLEQILSFHDDKLIVHWDTKKDVTNFKEHIIYLWFVGYEFFDENLVEIYDEGNSIVDPYNSDNDEERNAIIGCIRDVPFFVAYVMEDDGSDGGIPTVRIYSVRLATKNELNTFYNKGKKRQNRKKFKW